MNKEELILELKNLDRMKFDLLHKEETTSKTLKPDSHNLPINLLNDPDWPQAIHENLICSDNPLEISERARGIICLMIEEDLDKKKFLDFGCGDGMCAVIANDEFGATSTGYDINRDVNWPIDTTALLTTNWEHVVKRGPYDVILMHDVLDHLKDLNSIGECLRNVKKILKRNGRLYVRCHPYTSKHATHSYEKFNKAYIHLVLNEKEMKKIKHEKTLKILKPIWTYENNFKELFKVSNRRNITDSVDPFFKRKDISDKIIKNLGFFPEFQMTLQFIDYTLKNNLS